MRVEDERHPGGPGEQNLVGVVIHLPSWFHQVRLEMSAGDDPGRAIAKGEVDQSDDRPSRRSTDRGPAAPAAFA